jgi:23S rRNA (adenine2030-N6)-methyltransferase
MLVVFGRPQYNTPMLSYLHGYHAGNHADVLKHTVLTALLTRLVAKDGALRYVETHAGAGGYELRTKAAQRNREYENGVAKVWTAVDAPAAVARWLTLAHRYNGAGALTRYPGSPWFAQQSLRSTDDLFLFELHPAEHRALRQAHEGNRRIKVLREDGLASCIGLVPPPSKRALTFIDPSYELRDEHRDVIDAVVKLHKRFASGAIAIWYPIIERRWAERYERALRAAGIGKLATYELTVARERPSGGLIGSGIFIVNPPWQLDDELADALPWLAQRLAVDEDASFRVVP